jgi:DNA helicase-2/ATP-dependent DNA helicase PcrA
VVGDGDQSIYAFRGATMRNILDFESDYPEAKVILLEQNYRSTQTILSAANAVIANNLERKPKNLWTALGGGQPIVRYQAENEHDEAAWVVEEIERLRRQGFDYGQVVVFYRTNAQSRVLEEVFVKAGEPYKVVGGVKFYDRREVKDLLAYLKATVNPLDTVSLRRVLNVPAVASATPRSAPSSGSRPRRRSPSPTRCAGPGRCPASAPARPAPPPTSWPCSTSCGRGWTRDGSPPSWSRTPGRCPD